MDVIRALLEKGESSLHAVFSYQDAPDVVSLVQVYGEEVHLCTPRSVAQMPALVPATAADQMKAHIRHLDLKLAAALLFLKEMRREFKDKKVKMGSEIMYSRAIRLRVFVAATTLLNEKRDIFEQKLTDVSRSITSQFSSELTEEIPTWRKTVSLQQQKEIMELQRDGWMRWCSDLIQVLATALFEKRFLRSITVQGAEAVQLELEQTRCRARLAVYMEELMQRACHPSRIEQI